MKRLDQCLHVETFHGVEGNLSWEGLWNQNDTIFNWEYSFDYS